MLEKIAILLKKQKGKNTIKKFEKLTKLLEHMVRYDIDILIRGNDIPYRVTTSAGISRKEWEATPDDAFSISIEQEDPDLLGKLIFNAIMQHKKPTDTTFTFVDYDSQTVKLRVKGDNYSDPIFIAEFKGLWNGKLADSLREEEHKSLKETWRKSL